MAEPIYKSLWIQRLLRFSLLGCCLLFCFNVHAKPLRMVDDRTGLPAYAKGLLKLILSKVPNEYEWDESTPSGTEGRITQMLVDNELDIVWYATTNEFEDRMQPIRFPIFKGLLGYRILMIKTGTQHKFDGIRTLEDLRRVSLGQGRLWADTDVLTANGLNVVKVMKYENLFFMLDGDRFDAFPRGAHEPWSEIKRYPQLALTVENNISLVYTSPFYFFVNKANTDLAKALETGFRIAIEDGSFHAYFMNDPTVKDAVEKANLKNRIIIPLNNPTLPKLTPVDDKTLWFDPYSLSE
jgi:hypothetical protein